MSRSAARGHDRVLAHDEERVGRHEAEHREDAKDVAHA
jgi:hypothetical protein